MNLYAFLFWDAYRFMLSFLEKCEKMLYQKITVEGFNYVKGIWTHKWIWKRNHINDKWRKILRQIAEKLGFTHKQFRDLKQDIVGNSE